MPGNLPVPPASVTSQWPKPNYIDPVRRTWMPAYAISIHLFGTLLVFVRFGLRAQKEGGGFGLDDAFLLPSWLLSTALTALAIYSSKLGLIDRHIWDVPPRKYEDEALNAWIASFVFLMGSCCFKLSVLLFYRRIQAKTYNPKWMIAIYSAMAFTVLYTSALLSALIFNCNPTQAYWKAYDPEWKVDYHCVDTIAVSVLAGVLSVIGDAYSVALPCLMLQGLRILRRQKIGLNIVFAIGSLVAAAGVVRTYEFHRLTREWDTTWVGFSVYFWSILEYELGIMCACAPSLRVFFKTYVHNKARNTIRQKHSTGKDNENHTWSMQANGGQTRAFRPTMDPITFKGSRNGTYMASACHDPRHVYDDEEEFIDYEAPQSGSVVQRQPVEYTIPPAVWVTPPPSERVTVETRSEPKPAQKGMSLIEFLKSEG